jgi:N-methylhydantoinase A
LVHRGATPKPPVLAKMGDITDAAQAKTGSRPVHFGEGFSDVPTYNGALLGAGAEVVGPALIEEPFTVVVLAPGDVARLDEHGNYDITIAH